jgi:hypothetical protein
VKTALLAALASADLKISRRLAARSQIFEK